MSNQQPEDWQLNRLQRDDLNQADIAPLMSILLGISIPVNSLVRF
jgi:phosphatidylinositol glycan class N